MVFWSNSLARAWKFDLLKVQPSSTRRIVPGSTTRINSFEDLSTSRNSQQLCIGTKCLLMMQGFEIVQLISKFSSEVYKSLVGIVSIDQIPKNIPEHHYLISNLSTSLDSIGSHWIVSFLI